MAKLFNWVNRNRYGQLGLAALLLTLLSLVFVVPHAPRAADEDKKAEDEKLIQPQLFNDIMYGSDEYFGENTDLGYSDRVVPSGSDKDKKDEDTTTTPLQLTTAADDQGDDDDDDDDDGKSPPPDEPPPDEPPEPPDEPPPV